jgi:hypothetical protein
MQLCSRRTKLEPGTLSALDQVTMGLDNGSGLVNLFAAAAPVAAPVAAPAAVQSPFARSAKARAITSRWTSEVPS